MSATRSLHIRAATRASALAQWQTDAVSEALIEVAARADITLTVEKVLVETTADQRLDIPIHAMGGKGVFVKEVQAAVLDGRADIAVHSGKDLPAITPEGLVIAAVPLRADARDLLIGSTLDGLTIGAVVASGSIRRRAQLAHLRPDLRFADLRGNIATRLAKSVDFDAIVMAAAAIDRLDIDLSDRAIELLDPAVMLPQVAQGAMAVECRSDATALIELLALIEDPASRIAVEAERAFLAELGGDCDLPAGAYATLHGNILEIEAILASEDGTTVLRERRRVPAHDSRAVGRELARELLDHRGGAELLRDR
jgi:hydroxymethylbilane synthase